MRKKNKGQIVILVALFMLVLIILFSLIADVGKVYLWQKKLEMAVDAAALAGGQTYAFNFTSLELQSSAQDQAEAVAIYYAGLNGADTNNVTVIFLDELNDTVPVGGGEQVSIAPSTLEEVVAFLGLYPELAYANGKGKGEDDGDGGDDGDDGDGGGGPVAGDGIFETIQVDATKMVPLMFTKMLGIESKQISAQAATRIGGAVSVGGGGAAPWGPPDMNYQVCQRYIIKRGQDSRLPPGGGTSNCSGLALPGSTGGNDYRDNIVPGPPGFTGILRVGDMITTEPGLMVGPTGQGTQARLDACPHNPQCGGCSYVPGCPRIVVVPIMNIFDNGRIERPIIRFETFLLDNNSLNNNDQGFTKYSEDGVEVWQQVGNGGVTATYIGSAVVPSGEMGGLTPGSLGGIKVTHLIR